MGESGSRGEGEGVMKRHLQTWETNIVADVK